MFYFLLASALAAPPDPPNGMEDFDLSSLMQLGDALPAPPTTPGTRYVTAATVALRWPDGVETAASLDAGDRVEIVSERAGLVRVRSGTDFGWVPPSSLSTQPVDIQVGDP